MSVLPDPPSVETARSWSYQEDVEDCPLVRSDRRKFTGSGAEPPESA